MANKLFPNTFESIFWFLSLYLGQRFWPSESKIFLEKPGLEPTTLRFSVSHSTTWTNSAHTCLSNVYNYIETDCFNSDGVHISITLLSATPLLSNVITNCNYKLISDQWLNFPKGKVKERAGSRQLIILEQGARSDLRILSLYQDFEKWNHCWTLENYIVQYGFIMGVQYGRLIFWLIMPYLIYTP